MNMKMRYDGKRFAAFAAAVIALSGLSGCADSSGKEQKPAEATTTAAAPAETEAPVKVTLPPQTTAEGAETTVAPADTVGEETPNTPAMWKVTSPSGHEMYMMGSMHALNRTCYPLPDYVEEAYENCDVLAVECDITDILSGTGVQLKYSDKMTYPGDETIKDHLSAETWENVSGFFKHFRRDPEKYEKNCTWVIYSLLQSVSLEGSGLTAARGIDRYLLDEAHKDDKEIYEVESVDSQLTMLMNFSDELYEKMLAPFTPENADELFDQNIELFKAWKTGDVEWVEANAVSDLPQDTEISDELMNEYYNTMYYERNAHMAKDAEELLDGDKKVFYVVGLAHYVGDHGLLTLMEKDGYKVERVDTENAG